ncbi:hypothetical protein [Chakrabartyella piscis]|uniref:hypothetical protein n=1 Tax=Chakrabartyella piscis TaxID=2918914 RepID=UPI0029583866|nr:hypothetical protein [Chakrabartyella piscis]
MNTNSRFMHASEVAEELGISVAHAYKIVRELNKELSKDEYLTISGKVSRDYFYEKIYVKQRREG